MLSLLEMSFYGGVLVAVVAVIRLLAIGRLPKAPFLLLWAAALFRLLVPLRLPSPTSIWAVPALQTAPRRAGLLLASGETQAVPDTALRAAESGLFGLSPLVLAWALGAAALGIYFLFCHLNSRRNYQVSLPLRHPFVDEWLSVQRTRRPVRVRYSDQISSPLTYGVLRPVILLPKQLDWADEQTLAFILTHEMAHVRRMDALTKWLLAAALCLHWFNPLVWVMYLLANRDLELSCDEAVVRRYGREARSPYALALVSLEEKRSGFAPLASSFSKSALTERITAIMHSRRLTAISLGVALILAGVVIGVFATLPPAQSETSALAAGNRADRHVAVTQNGSGTALQIGALNDGYTGQPQYTAAQYDELMAALRPEGWETWSIARFNRSLYAALTNEKNHMLYYELALDRLPDNTADAAFLRNTVSASLNEYETRLNEAYSGERQDPDFYGQASLRRSKTILGEQLRTELSAGYTITYRILDQDALTVAERDAFLQQVMQAAQTSLEQLADSGTAADLQSALSAACTGFSNEKIEFTGCTIEHVDVY